jgi:hypothetical protein
MDAPIEARTWKPRDEINPRDRREVRYWARRFHTDEDELLRVVTEVGARTAAVATVFGCVVGDGEVRCG